jgi:hypothetical protein
MASEEPYNGSGAVSRPICVSRAEQGWGGDSTGALEKTKLADAESIAVARSLTATEDFEGKTSNGGWQDQTQATDVR